MACTCGLGFIFGDVAKTQRKIPDFTDGSALWPHWSCPLENGQADYGTGPSLDANRTGVFLLQIPFIQGGCSLIPSPGTLPGALMQRYGF